MFCFPGSWYQSQQKCGKEEEADKEKAGILQNNAQKQSRKINK